MFRSRGLGRYLKSSNNRAAGPLFLCVLALALSVSVGWSLPAVPDTILLPDSLGPLRPGYHVAFGSSTNNIYVASESSDILVVDGNTFQRIARINTGTPVGTLLLASQRNKLYCTYPSLGRIGVIDCPTNDTVGSIQVSTKPKVLCYSSGSDKLYCCDSVYRKISVIDCAADTVRKVITTAYSPADMVYDPTTNKVYVETKYSVLVISCATDSVITTLSGQYMSGLCLNQRRGKLYVPGSNVPETLYVVSTQSDSVTAAIPSTRGVFLACNEATDRLYCTGPGSHFVDEYDCVGDTYTSYGYFPGMEACAIACDTVHNRLLFRSTYELLVIDCTSFDVVVDLGAGADCHVHCDPLAWNQARYSAMCTGWVDEEAWGAMTMYDCKSDTPYYRGTVPLSGWGHRMSHNPATSRLYCSLGGSAAVIDEHTNRQVGLARGVGGSMAYSRTSNKFYFPVVYGPSDEYQGLGVMDGSTDSLIKVVGLGDYRWQPFPCWCPDGNKVYCFASKGARLFMVAVDCQTDSVVWERDMYDLGRWFEYLDNGLILCNHSDSLALIDPHTDSVLVDSSLEAGAVYAVTHTGDGEKFYLVRRYPGRLEVRSSSTLKLLSTIAWPYFDWSGTLLSYSDTTRKLYWLVDDSVLAIDATSDTITARIATPAPYNCLRFDHTGRYLFCSSSATDRESCLVVYDTQSDSLVAEYPNLPPIGSIAMSPEQRRIYVGCSDLILVYSDVPPGVGETPSVEVRETKVGPTVVRSVLHLPASDFERGTPIVLMDVSGRKVLDLRPGPNDVRTVAPGVYFVREEPQASSSRPQAVRKVVVTR
jgi:DNA-binding beta-propeller fold protein YncE